MPETEMILSVVALLLLAWLTWQIGRVLSCLLRIEARMKQGGDGQAARGGEPSMAAAPKPGTAYDAFLAEDPSRRELPKAEQFAAYRKWRREKGLNWEKS